MGRKHTDRAYRERRIVDVRHGKGVARERDCEWKEGGRHNRIIGRDGRSVSVPRHGNDEINRNTGRAIFKQLVAMGILFLIMGVMLFMAFGELI